MFKKGLLIVMSITLIWKYNELISFYDYFLMEQNLEVTNENIIRPKKDDRDYKAF